MPLRPAQRFAAHHALQLVEPDLGLPPFAVSCQGTWRARNDPGHRGLRGLVAGLRFAPTAPRRAQRVRR